MNNEIKDELYILKTDVKEYELGDNILDIRFKILDIIQKEKFKSKVYNLYLKRNNEYGLILNTYEIINLYLRYY